MSVPVEPVRSCRLALENRTQPRSHYRPFPSPGARHPRHHLTNNTGTAVTKFQDEGDILRLRQTTRSKSTLLVRHPIAK
jgi:hypothetical protein